MLNLNMALCPLLLRPVGNHRQEVNMDATPAIISALIAGTFSLVGIVLNHKLTSGSGSTRTASVMQTVARTSQPPTPVRGTVISTPQSMKRVNFGKVLIHIGIIQLVANVMGLIIGLVLGSNGASIDTTIVWLLVVGTIILIASFYLSGISVDRAIMWKHLTLRLYRCGHC